MKKIYILLALALILRMLWFRDNFFFGFEQGRDFIKLSEIASGNLTLIGPKTDINGIFHGALSYYLLIPSFILFSGNPYLVAVSLIGIQVFSIYFLFKFAREFVDAKYAYLVVLLYSVSYASIVYARWLSNPNLVPALTIFVLYFLQKARRQNYYFVLVAICWAIIFHLQVIAAMLLFFPIAYVALSKIITLKIMLLSLGAVFLVLSSYFLFNYKNDNILFNGVRNYLTSGERQVPHSVRLDEFFNETVDNFFPDNRTVAFILFWIVILTGLWDARKNPKSRQLMIFYLAAPVLFLTVRTSPLRHLFILNSLFVSLLLAYTLRIFYKNGLYILSLIIISLYLAGNIGAIFSRLPSSNRNFIYHAQSTYFSDEVKLLDYVYSDSDGASFSYNYYTVPYWQPAAWEYLFKWYGKEKFGYLPVENQTEVFYVLYEPDETQPKYQNDWYQSLNQRSNILDSFESGKLKAEKRKQI